MPLSHKNSHAPQKTDFSRLFRKYYFFWKKLFDKKVFKTSFPIKKKVILTFVARHCLSIKNKTGCDKKKNKNKKQTKTKKPKCSKIQKVY